MALTTNKKNKIIAEWKAGLFTSYNAVATTYKIDPKTVKKILDGISQTNTDIVEAGAIYETAKKSIKNPNEIRAIEKAIKRDLSAEELKLDIYEAQSLAVQRVKELLTSNKKIVAMKLKNGEFDTVEKHEIELSPQDLQTCIDGIDKASITLKVNERHAPKQDIALTNAQQNNKQTIIQIVRDNGN